MDLLEVEVRCTLAHELLHAIRGPVAHYNKGKEETAVNRIAVKMLIPMDQLADAVVAATSIWETAELLDVDAGTVRLRLQNLNASEKK